MLQPEDFPSLQGISGAIFQQDKSRPHVQRNVLDFCSAQLVQLLPAYSLDILRIEHVWDLIGRRLGRDLRSSASKVELRLFIQAI